MPAASAASALAVKSTDITTSNPRTGAQVGQPIALTTQAEMFGMAKAASTAHDAMLLKTPLERAKLLSNIADALELRKAQIIDTCSQETGYAAEPRVTAEFGRTVFTLREFSRLLTEGKVDHVEVTQGDDAARLLKGFAPIVSKLQGRGPVLNIESSNFPLAFGVMGTDSISALATGCPVISKVHNLHAQTSKLVGEAVAEAIEKAGFPKAAFSLLYGTSKEILQLAARDEIAAITITGSRQAGDSIQQVINQRATGPIPLYGEYGAVNPVVMGPSVLADPERRTKEVEAIFGSNQLCGGQFCTKPGVIIVPEGPGAKEFVDALAAKFNASVPQVMLGKRIADGFAARRREMQGSSDVKILGSCKLGMTTDLKVNSRPVLYGVKPDAFVLDHKLREELFGPAAVVVVAPQEKIPGILKSMGGQLTTTFLETAADKDLILPLAQQVVKSAGRTVFNGVPTGVDVCPTMHHTGAYPATSCDVTSAGTHSRVWQRFQVARSLQNVPAHLAELVGS